MRPLCVAAVIAAACSSPAAKPPVQTPANHADDPAAATAKDPLAFLPVDSEIVLGLELKTLRGSALWKELQPLVDSAVQGASEPAFRNCIAGSIDSIGGVTLGMKLGGDSASGVVVVRGVDAPAMANCLERELRTAQVVETVDRGVVIAKTPHSKAALGAVGSSTLVLQIDAAASHDSFAGVLAAGVPLHASEAFLALQHRLEQGATLWTVMNGSSKLFEQLSALGVKTRSFDGTIVVTDKVTIAGRLAVDSADSAKNLADVATPQLGQLKAMFDKLDVTATGDVVHLDAAMTSEQLKNLLGLFGLRAS